MTDPQKPTLQPEDNPTVLEQTEDTSVTEQPVPETIFTPEED